MKEILEKMADLQYLQILYLEENSAHHAYNEIRKMYTELEDIKKLITLIR